jgi:hypothetical protein
VGVPETGRHAQPLAPPGQSRLSVGAPPQDGGLPDGHDAWQEVLEGPPLLANVMQQTSVPLQSPPVQGMEAAPLGQAAAVAAHVPSKFLPIGARQQTCVPGQLGQLLRVTVPLLLPPASVRAPLLLPTPLLPPLLLLPTPLLPLLLRPVPLLLPTVPLLPVPLLPVPLLPNRPLLLAVPTPLLLTLPSIVSPASPASLTPPQATARATTIDAIPKMRPPFMVLPPRAIARKTRERKYKGPVRTLVTARA